MCCNGNELAEVAEELAATREPPMDATAQKPLELRYGPSFRKHPLTGEMTVPAFPQKRQIFVRGMRIGYVTVTPGGPISLLRPWDTGQLEIIRLAVLEELALSGFDVQQPRKFTCPKYAGLLNPDAEDESDEPSPIIIP